MREIVIKPDQMTVANGDMVLTTKALGSSIAVCMFDVGAGIGGMVHTLLPDSRISLQGNDKLKYTDTAIEVLYGAMKQAGADASAIRVKLVGGAKIFCFSGQNIQPDTGRENVISARKKLQELELTIVAEDTGENYGRSVHFNVSDGKLEIETVNRSSYWI